MANVDIIDNCSIAFFLFRPHNSVLTKDYPYRLFAMPVESFPPIAVGLMGTVSQSSSPIIRLLLISCRVNTPPVSLLQASQSLTRRYILIRHPQNKVNDLCRLVLSESPCSIFVDEARSPSTFDTVLYTIC